MSESKQKIKVNELKSDEIYSLAAMLIKAGYTVRRGRENRGTSTRAKYEYFIEYWEGV